MPCCSRRRGRGPREAAWMRALQAHLHQFVAQRAHLEKVHKAQGGIKFTRTLPYNSKQPVNLPKKLLLFSPQFFSPSPLEAPSEDWRALTGTVVDISIHVHEWNGSRRVKASVKNWMGSWMASLVSLLSWTESSNTRSMSPDVLLIFTTAHETHLRFLHWGFFFSLSSSEVWLVTRKVGVGWFSALAHFYFCTPTTVSFKLPSCWKQNWDESHRV